MGIGNVLRNPIALAVGTLASVGVMSYSLNDATKTNVAGGIGMLGATVGGLATMVAATGKLGRLSPLTQVAAVTLAPAAVIGAYLGGQALTGGGKAKPLASVEDMVNQYASASETLHSATGTPIADRAQLDAYVKSFDRYAQHGAKADDGLLTESDVRAFGKASHPEKMTRTN